MVFGSDFICVNHVWLHQIKFEDVTILSKCVDGFLLLPGQKAELLIIL